MRSGTGSLCRDDDCGCYADNHNHGYRKVKSKLNKKHRLLLLQGWEAFKSFDTYERLNLTPPEKSRLGESRNRWCCTRLVENSEAKRGCNKGTTSPVPSGSSCSS